MIHRWLELRHHKYSGAVLPHYHTSYAALFILVFFCAGLLMAVGAALPGQVAAGTLTQSGTTTVTGRVPGPPPSVAPTITSPATGRRFGSARIDVSGDCIEADVVVIASNGVDRGSAICDSLGRFTLSIDLFPGRNDLVARQYDSLDQVSPTSTPPVTVFYDLPQPPQPPPSSPTTSPKPAAPARLQPAVPTAPAPLLLISALYRYQGASPGVAFSIKPTIASGTSPYAVAIDWGDGRQNVKSRSAAGAVSFEHVYAKAGSYVMKLTVSDSLGATSYFQTVVIVQGSVAAATAPPDFSGRLIVAWPILIVVGLALFSFWLGEQYDRRLRHRDSVVA